MSTWREEELGSTCKDFALFSALTTHVIGL